MQNCSEDNEVSMPTAFSLSLSKPWTQVWFITVRGELNQEWEKMGTIMVSWEGHICEGKDDSGNIRKDEVGSFIQEAIWTERQTEELLHMN